MTCSECSKRINPDYVRHIGGKPMCVRCANLEGYKFLMGKRETLQ